MISRERWIIGVIILVVCLNGSPVYASGPFDKFGRGVGNLLTGWLELPVQVMRTTQREGSFAGASAGFVKGVAFGLGRTAIGLLEAVTFLLPNYPRQGPPHEQAYDPILDPPYIQVRSADKL